LQANFILKASFLSTSQTILETNLNLTNHRSRVKDVVLLIYSWATFIN